MRILCVGNRFPPWSIGGYEVICARAVHALQARGHCTRVLSTFPDPDDLPVAEMPDADVHRELTWYWREHEFPRIGWRDCAALERANARALSRHLRIFRPHVLMWWAMGGMSLSLLEQGRRAGIPALGVVGDDWMIYGPRVDAWTRRWSGVGRLGGPAAERLVGVPTRLRLEQVAKWIFISRHTRQVACQAGWPLQDATVAHPGVDPARFPCREPRSWGWRLLYCGRLDPRKGIETAIRALLELPPQATLTIDGHGDPEHAAQLTRLATDLGLGERVRFQRSLGAALPEVYAQADVVVFPVTWQEPWGLVPLESMSVGRPVVASRAGGGAAEYLQDGINCLQFSPGDSGALADCVRRLAADQELGRVLRAGGRATARRLSESVFHQALEQELTDLLAPGA